MRAARQVLKSVLRPWIRRQARGQLDRVRRCGTPVSEHIASAIDDVLTNKFSSEERNWVDRIESLRKQLDQNTAPLPMVEFAGSNGVRTLEEMPPGMGKSCTIGEACRASKTYFWSMMLFKLVRKLQPTTIIELGTCLGISAAYQAAAEQLNGHGRVITLEGSASRAALSRRHLDSLGLTNVTVVPGIFEDTLEATLVANSLIDYAFIDGHHDEHATIKYYEQFLPYLIDDAVVVFDDIAWSPGMRRAWTTLQSHRNVALSIDLMNVGLCVVQKTPSPNSRRFRIRMPT